MGGAGALIFSLKISDPDLPREAGLDPGWATLRQPELLGSLARACLLGEAEEERAGLAAEIVALSRGGVEPARGSPPLWLEAVRTEIREGGAETSIDAAAARAGVHRVYLSRAFHRYFGMPPSVYRLRCLAARTVSAAMTGRRSLAEAAYAGGFCDQSHAARAVKKSTSLTLSQMRALAV